MTFGTSKGNKNWFEKLGTLRILGKIALFARREGSGGEGMKMAFSLSYQEVQRIESLRNRVFTEQTKEADYKSLFNDHQNGSDDIARKPRALSLKKITLYGHLNLMDAIWCPYGALGNYVYKTVIECFLSFSEHFIIKVKLRNIVCKTICNKQEAYRILHL